MLRWPEPAQVKIAGWPRNLTRVGYSPCSPALKWSLRTTLSLLFQDSSRCWAIWYGNYWRLFSQALITWADKALYFPVYICLPAWKFLSPLLCGPWLAGSKDMVSHGVQVFLVWNYRAISLLWSMYLSPHGIHSWQNYCPRPLLTLSYSQQPYRFRDKRLGVEKSCDLSGRAGPEHRQAPVLLDRCRSAACQVGQLEDLVWAVFKFAFSCLSSRHAPALFFVCLFFVFNEKGLCMELVMTSVQRCCLEAVQHLSFFPLPQKSLFF